MTPNRKPRKCDCHLFENQVCDICQGPVGKDKPLKKPRKVVKACKKCKGSGFVTLVSMLGIGVVSCPSCYKKGASHGK